MRDLQRVHVPSHRFESLDRVRRPRSGARRSRPTPGCWPSCRPSADDTGTSERITTPSTGSPRDSSRSRNAPVIAASTTSLTVPPRPARIFQISRGSSGQPPIADGGRWSPRWTVPARAHVTSEASGPPSESRNVATARRGSPKRGASGPQLLGWHQGELDQCIEREHVVAGLGSAEPTCPAAARAPGLGVEQQDHQVRAGDAIDHAVVDLRDQGPPTVGEALDHPRLPQRTAAVELDRHEPAHQVVELVLRPGRRQGGVAEVVPEVEVRVVDPHRPAELPGTKRTFCRYRGERGSLLSKIRRTRHTAAPVPRSRARGDVHVRHTVLDVEEHAVQRAQPIHRPTSMTREPRRPWTIRAERPQPECPESPPRQPVLKVPGLVRDLEHARTAAGVRTVESIR